MKCHSLSLASEECDNKPSNLAFFIPVNSLQIAYKAQQCAATLRLCFRICSTVMRQTIVVRVVCRKQGNVYL